MSDIEKKMSKLYSRIVVEESNEPTLFEAYFGLHRLAEHATEKDHDVMMKYFLYQRSLGQGHELLMDEELPVMEEIKKQIPLNDERDWVVGISPLGIAVVGRKSKLEESSTYYYWDFIKEAPLMGEERFSVAHLFSQGFGLLRKDSSWFFITIDGDFAFDGRRFNFYYATPFSEGFACTTSCGGQHSNFKYDCYLKIDGTLAFNGRQFFDINEFSEGLAAVCDTEDRGYFYIDQEGKQAFGERIFDYAENFENGYAIVEDWCGERIINKKGELIFGESFFKEIKMTKNGIATAIDYLGEKKQTYRLHLKERQIELIRS